MFIFMKLRWQIPRSCDTVNGLNSFLLNTVISQDMGGNIIKYKDWICRSEINKWDNEHLEMERKKNKWASKLIMKHADSVVSLYK